VHAASPVGESALAERQILPHLRYSEQFPKDNLAVLAGAKLADQLDEHVGLQPVENPARSVQRGDLRTPDGAMLKQNADGASPLDTFCGDAS
jgi:hypothetical protein